ncbi:MAG: hypothetical protein ACREFD_01340, partial [Stellaceae bacterium]
SQNVVGATFQSFGRRGEKVTVAEGNSEKKGGRGGNGGAGRNGTWNKGFGEMSHEVMRGERFLPWHRGAFFRARRNLVASRGELLIAEGRCAASRSRHMTSPQFVSLDRLADSIDTEEPNRNESPHPWPQILENHR